MTEYLYYQCECGHVSKGDSNSHYEECGKPLFKLGSLESHAMRIKELECFLQVKTAEHKTAKECLHDVAAQRTMWKGAYDTQRKIVNRLTSIHVSDDMLDQLLRYAYHAEQGNIEVIQKGWDLLAKRKELKDEKK